MNKLDLTIDFSEKEDKLSVIHCFEQALEIPLSELGNWDAFYDYLTSLSTESELIKRKKPESLHITLKNIIDFEQRCRNIKSNDYEKLLDLLGDATDKNRRYDDIDFTFAITNRIA